MKFIKHYLWFVKESYSFMQGHNKLYITYWAIVKGFSYAKDMSAWDKATEQQREAWYASGEGRTIDF